MGKINVPLDQIVQRISFGMIALFGLIVLSGFVISAEQDISANEGMLMSLSFATHIEPDKLSEANLLSKVLFVTLGFAGEVLTFYVFYLIIEFIISGEMNKKLGGVKDIKMASRLKDHYIVCGGGRVGEHLAEKLKGEGRNVVIIDQDELKIAQLKRKGYRAILGSANTEEALSHAGIMNAHSLAAVVGDDGTNLLTILTAKELNEELSIAARANDESIVSKLKHAGAEVVILPEVVGGMKLADAILGDIDHGHVIHHPENSKRKK